MTFDIPKVSHSLKRAVQQKIDSKTKPIGALGSLEQLALQIALIQETLSPELLNPHLLVFAADHGIAKDGVSAYPQEVTHQMVLNFLAGGAAINVFARQHNIQLKVIDAGVNHDFGNIDGLISAKVGHSTNSFLKQKAMSSIQCLDALAKGSSIIEDLGDNALNIIGFGEMGIANTSSAAMIMHYVTKLPLVECIGRGTGLNDDGLSIKKSILESARSFHGEINEGLEILETFGGFEIAMIVGAMCKAASKRILMLIDGFISSAAFLIAHNMYPQIKDYAVFCHQSDESGHKKMLDYIGVEAVLKLNMRLGEGTGCALAYPIIKSSVNFLNEMASFESAGVSNKS